MTSFPFKVRIAPNVISQEVLLGETLLMDVKTLVYFGLDELGTSVWRAIRECPDADAAFARLRASSELDEAALARKFDMIIKGLLNSHIIEIEEQAGSDTPR